MHKSPNPIPSPPAPLLRPPSPPASLARRLAALSYDALLLLALLFIAAIPWALAGHGEPLASLARAAYQLYLIGVSGLFFGWFWTHGGQTLGMRAWRLRLIGDDRGAVTAKRAAIRFGVGLVSLAALGLGFWWSLFAPDGKTWHDRAARTQMELLPKSTR